MSDPAVEGTESQSFSDSMRFVLQAAGIGWWDLDIEANTTRRSLLHDQLFGYTEMLPTWSYDDYLGHVHPDDRALVADSFATALDGGEPYALDVRVVWPDGTVHWIFTRGQFLLDDDGAPKRVAGVVGDITERKLAEIAAMTEKARAVQAAAENLALLEALLGSAPIGFAFVDSSYRFVRINEVLAAMNGLGSVTEALGSTIAEIVPDLWPQVEPILERVLRDSQAVTDVAIRGETLAQPGVQREWMASYFPVLVHATSAASGVGIIVQDVTERVVLETHLRQAQKLKALGLLAGGVAHDFNNTLGVITLAAEYADSRNDNEVVGVELQRIVEVARSSQALTRQLIQFSRNESAPSELVDVSFCVETVAAFLTPTLGEHIAARLDLSQVPMVRISRSQLEQILVNLAINARDAMPHGGDLVIQTRVNTIAEDPDGLPPGEYVEVCVIDSGVGMSAEVIEHAFEPFFTTKDASGGSGLGLATVYGIATTAHGDVRIESIPGHGTSIRVRLPASDDQHHALEQVRTAPLPTRARHVVVVDDQEALRVVVERILRSAGYTVHSGTAQAILDHDFDVEESPELLITDLVMPDMSGPELAARFTDRWPDVRVIFMSGYSHDTLPHTLPPGRPFTLLAKPFGTADILRAVSETLDDTAPGVVRRR